MNPDRAHNDYLNLLADWGATGGIIVLAGMAAFGAVCEKRGNMSARRKMILAWHEQSFRFFSRRVHRTAGAGGAFVGGISICTFQPMQFSV